jgi:hypothetical protein
MSANTSFKATAAADPKAAINTTLQVGEIVTQANERLFELHVEAAKAAYMQNSKAMVLITQEPAGALAQWPSLFQENAQRMMDVTRSWFEIVAQTQAELTKLLGNPFASYNAETKNYFDQFMKAVAQGPQAAASQMKEFLAKTTGDDDERKPVKKDKTA